MKGLLDPERGRSPWVENRWSRSSKMPYRLQVALPVVSSRLILPFAPEARLLTSVVQQVGPRKPVPSFLPFPRGAFEMLCRREFAVW